MTSRILTARIRLHLACSKIEPHFTHCGDASSSDLAAPSISWTLRGAGPSSEIFAVESSAHLFSFVRFRSATAAAPSRSRTTPRITPSAIATFAPVFSPSEAAGVFAGSEVVEVGGTEAVVVVVEITDVALAHIDCRADCALATSVRLQYVGMQAPNSKRKVGEPQKQLGAVALHRAPSRDDEKQLGTKVGPVHFAPTTWMQALPSLLSSLAQAGSCGVGQAECGL